MKKVFYLTCFIFFLACEKVELIPMTSEQIISQVTKYAGEKAVLLNFWSLYCVPCVDKFPMLMELDEKFEDIVVIFVNTDFEDEYHKVEKYLKVNHVVSPSYIKDEKDEPFINGIDPKWTGALPFTMVFSKETGNVVDLWEGSMPDLRFENAVYSALNS